MDCVCLHNRDSFSLLALLILVRIECGENEGTILLVIPMLDLTILHS